MKERNAADACNITKLWFLLLEAEPSPFLVYQLFWVNILFRRLPWRSVSHIFPLILCKLRICLQMGLTRASDCVYISSRRWAQTYLNRSQTVRGQCTPNRTATEKKLTMRSRTVAKYCLGWKGPLQTGLMRWPSKKLHYVTCILHQQWNKT